MNNFRLAENNRIKINRNHKTNSYITSILLSKKLLGVFLILILSSGFLFAQQKTSNSDQALKGSGRVNPSTLAMEFNLPLGSYPGRGINMPISLSYSSKVWRMKTSRRETFGQGGNSCKTYSEPKYAEDSASGWTSSLAVPVIEYTGWRERVTVDGFPVVEWLCFEPEPQIGNIIRKITVRLPNGASHELRSDATGSGTGTSGTYYAADGSNLIYYENTITNTYKLMLPDGSFYTFGGSAGTADRKATKYTDRNGNYISYNSSTKKWTDTLGKQLESPLNDTTEGIKTYQLQGLTGTYKFHWEKLEDAFTSPSTQLKYPGDTYASGGSYAQRSAGDTLFQSNTLWDNRVEDSVTLFNPVVLSKIELPTGQAYEFSYDEYGQITKIKYPTGGEETFIYSEIKPLTPVIQWWSDVTSQVNLGVTVRTQHEPIKNQNYNWTYSTDYVNPKGYKISVENPEGLLTERFLHRGENDCIGCSTGTFGFEDILVGKPYESRVYDDGDRLVSRTLTHWTKNSIVYGNGTADWHPRVTHIENYKYDPSNNGNYVKATNKFEYESTSTLDKPLLRKKTLQYAYEGGSSGSNPYPSGTNPLANPTPIPTPTPANLIRSEEKTYLIYDTSIPQTTRDNYINNNLVDLQTEAIIKDGSTIVSKIEIKYDESGYSPAIGRGNPTTARVWDDTKGAVTNPSAYIETHGKFDNDGNQIEKIDSLGRVTSTTYDATHNTFPIKVTSPIPDSSGIKGSNTALVTEATYDFTTGLPLTTKNANGQVTTFEYDPTTLRTTKMIPPTGGSIKETIYNDDPTSPDGVWVKNRTQIDTNNWAESVTYLDGLGREYKAKQIHSDEDIVIERKFDSKGREHQVSNPYRVDSNGNPTETVYWTTNTYDDASRIIEEILPDGAKITIDYGVSTTGQDIGETVTVTDQAGKKKRLIENVLGQVIRIDEPNASGNLGSFSSPTQATYYEYDILGNLTKVTQGQQIRTFTYNSFSKILSATNPESGTVSYNYDDNGNLTSRTDAKGITTTYTYDNFDRIIKRDYSDSTPDVDYYYDNLSNAKGKLIKISSSVSTTEYTSFDTVGRILSHQQTTDSVNYTTSYKYNLSGALIEQTYPNGRVIQNVLDNDGYLSIVQSKKDQNAGFWNYADSFTYTSSGAVSSMQLGNGKWESVQFNSRLQPTQIALGTTQGGTDKLKLEYTYNTSGQNDNNGNVLSQTITVPTTGVTQGFTAIQTYIYDSLNRLKSAEEKISGSTSWKETFTYDRHGNRRFDETNTDTLAAGCATAVCNPQVDTATNKLVGYTFDNVGNTKIDAEGQTFTYNAENKQILVKNSSGTTIGEYFYDGDGKRIKKIASSIETTFVYDAYGKLIAEYSDQPPQTTQVNYLTMDHLGSPRIITDKNGQVRTRRDFLPFGEEISSIHTPERNSNLNYAGDSVKRKFTTYERDDETGLDFAQARYYSKSLGRFTTVDPLMASADIMNPQTLNRYVYVGNNPINITDPTGMIWGVKDGKIKWYKDKKAMEADGAVESKQFVGWKDGVMYALNPYANEAKQAMTGAIAIQQVVAWGASTGGVAATISAALGIGAVAAAAIAVQIVCGAPCTNGHTSTTGMLGAGSSRDYANWARYFSRSKKTKTIFDFIDSKGNIKPEILMSGNNEGGSSNSSSNAQDESSPADPNSRKPDDKDKKPRSSEENNDIPKLTGEQLSQSRVIAKGNGIRDINRLTDTYGGRAKDWRKKSSPVIDHNGRDAEVHWYENTRIGSGRKEEKIVYLD